MINTAELRRIIIEFKNGLTLNGRNRVFERGYELSSSDIQERSDPESYTRSKVLLPILNMFNLERLPERQFRGIKDDIRKVDYLITNQLGNQFILELKPTNSNLYKKGPSGAINQIIGLYRLAEVKEKYNFGIATDGFEWIFIDTNSEIVYQYNVVNDFNKIKSILQGEKEVIFENVEEIISSKFYRWYNALLHGGTFEDHLDRRRSISSDDSLVENILYMNIDSEKEQIAQVVIDRLLFLKFLQAKGLIKSSLLSYLCSLEEDVLNAKLNQLFFYVLNKQEEDRESIDPHFKEIPYLNGSLFTKHDVEKRNPYYKIKTEILIEILNFLDSFKFIHSEDETDKQILNPQILGYIFEKAMTKAERKSTGSYYTPKDITSYICNETIDRVIVDRVNVFLLEKGYKRGELIETLNDIYNLRDTTLSEIYEKIILDIKICDNACGSGAFLLSAANKLLEVYKQIKEELNLSVGILGLKRLILIKNIYGVDLNTNAVEIAKLRLWLWFVESYETQEVVPLPNIDYNIRVGNSLLGFVNLPIFSINDIEKTESPLLDSLSPEKHYMRWLSRRTEKIQEYQQKRTVGSSKLKEEIDSIDRLVSKFLTEIFYKNKIAPNTSITYNEYIGDIQPFHWGFEFQEVFQASKTGGFDIIIGNPPYGNILERVEKHCIFNYSSKDSGEIAANFVERSINLLKKNGYLGLIIANSIAINKKTSSVRNLIRKNMGKSKMALFGTRPAKIFPDAEIRVLIFTGKKDIPNEEGIIYTTDAIKFIKEDRYKLLNNLNFESTEGLSLGKERIGDEEDFSLPKVGYAIIRSILLKLKIQSKITLENRIAKKQYDFKLDFRKTGGYWLNAMETFPYASTKIEEIGFKNKLERDFTILLVNSSLFYLYWSTYGNLRDFPKSLLLKFPFPDFDTLLSNKTVIEDLSEKIDICLNRCFNPTRGRVGEFKTGLCKRLIDEIDKLLASNYDLNDKEVDYIMNYDSHIRKSLSEEEFEKTKNDVTNDLVL